jgi:hypothetical protein
MAYWRHIESDPIGTAHATLVTMRAHTWAQLDPATQARQMRAFLVMSLQAATLNTNEAQVLGRLSPEIYPDDTRCAMGAAVARTIMLLPPNGLRLDIQGDVATTDGLPMRQVIFPGPDVGLAPLAIIAIVAVVGAVAVLIAQQVASVVASENFNDNKTKQLMATQAATLDVIAKHADREKLAGKLTPYSDEERGVLEHLEGVQKEIIQQRQEPLPTPFQGAKELLQQAGSAALSALPLVIAAGLGLFLFSSETKRPHDETRI